MQELISLAVVGYHSAVQDVRAIYSVYSLFSNCINNQSHVIELCLLAK